MPDWASTGNKTLIFMKYWLHRVTGGDNALEFAHPLFFLGIEFT